MAHRFILCHNTTLLPWFIFVWGLLECLSLSCSFTTTTTTTFFSRPQIHHHRRCPFHDDDSTNDDNVYHRRPWRMVASSATDVVTNHIVTTKQRQRRPKSKRPSVAIVPTPKNDTHNNNHRHYHSYSYSYGYYATKLVQLATAPPKSKSNRPTPPNYQKTTTYWTNGRKAERLFRQMQSHYHHHICENNNSNNNNNNTNHNHFKKGTTRRSSTTTATKATAPNSYCMTLVITAYANSGHPRAHIHCQRLLQEMWTSNNNMTPDVVTYTAVLKAIGRSNRHTCGILAEELFCQGMMNVYPSCGNEDDTPHSTTTKYLVQPNIYSYGVLIDAWCRCYAPQSPERAEYWLRQLEQHYILPPTDTTPNTTTTFNYLASYTNVIEAWSKTTRTNNNAIRTGRRRPIPNNNSNTPYDKPSDPSQQQQQQHPPMTNNNPERAEALLLHMEQVYDKTHNPHIQPDAICYAHVINAWGKSQVKGGAERAQRIWMHMQNRFVDHQEVDGHIPNSDIHHLDCQHANANTNANSKQMMVNSDKSWNDCVLYTSVLDAWAREGNPEKAMEFFKYVTTNTSKYNNQGQQQQYNSNHNYNNNDINVMPNVRSYTALIHAYAKSTHMDRAQKARKILDDMIQLYQNNNNDQDQERLRPTVFTYTAVLRACFCHDDHNQLQQQPQPNKDKVYQIARKTWSELCGYDLAANDDGGVDSGNPTNICREGPNNVAYLTMIKAVASCRPIHHEDTDNVISNIFKRCCQDGMVHINIIRQLQRCVPPQVFEDLVLSPMARAMDQQEQHGTDTTTLGNRNPKKQQQHKFCNQPVTDSVVVESRHLPPAWSCNVIRK